ncbi:MAG: phage portal protein, partial [Cellulomonadaceae bacterium]|nr:phage portal protein [Cellulomonadaceae bacterium]
MSLFRATTLDTALGADGRGRRSSVMPRVTSDSALRQSVTWGACRLRADLISLMPVDVYRKVPGAGINSPVSAPPVLVEPSEIADGHPMSIGEWIYSGQMSLDRAGNNIGVITKVDALGLPAAIDLVSMDEVGMRIKDHRVVEYRINGEKVDPRLIWHERQHTVAGLPVRLSPIAYAAMYLAGADAAAQFALDWFVNGTVPSSILKNSEKTLSDAEAARAARKFEAAISTGRPFVTGKDWTYDPIAAKASESAFIDQMQYSDVALCRFHGVPADLVEQ